MSEDKIQQEDTVATSGSTGVRQLGYKFRLRPRPKQTERLIQYTAAARYAWNYSLEQYETALDQVRGRAAETADKAATASVREILETRMQGLGLVVARRGKGKERTLSLQSILYKLWCHHRDTSAPAWVQAATKGSLGGHSHVGSYPVSRLCDTIKRWWAAKGNRAPWSTSSERQAGKRSRASRSRASTGRLVGPPRYKRRGQNPSFTIQVGQEVIGRNVIKIPSVGRIYVDDRADQNPLNIIPQGAVPRLVTVREVAGKWEASVCVQEPWTTPDVGDLPACGIDLGINAEATIAWSDGRIERIEPPRPMGSLGIQLALLQVRLSLSEHCLRCAGCGAQHPLGDRNRRLKICDGCGGRMRRWRSGRGLRLQRRIAQLHDRISRVREDHLHNLSHRLVHESSAICTEGHNVTGLVSGGVERRCAEIKYRGIARRSIRRAMLDIGWGELRRQIAYKAAWMGREYMTLPKDTASDKTCWSCGTVNEVPSDTSEYICSGCGWMGTRQENTALLCLGHIQVPGGDSGRPGGDPAAGREDGTTGCARHTGSRAADRRGPGVNEGMDDTTPGALVAPGGSRNAQKARKVGHPSHRGVRA